MTASDYQAKGYKVSLQLEPGIILKAEEEAKRFYILPIVGTFSVTDDDHVNALAVLAYIGMCRTQIFATRSGGKVKNVNESVTASLEAVLQECALVADGYLQILRNKPNANKNAVLTDAFGIYFNTNFLNL